MSPRSEEQNQKIKEERHETILQAALKVFAEKGFAPTKITDIATAAGMSHGLIYHYFASKEMIYTAIIEAAVQRGAQMSHDAVYDSGSPWERLRTLCEWTIAGIRNYPEYYAVLLQALTSPDIPSEARALLKQADMSTYMHMLMQQGQEAGQIIAGDPVELTDAFYALIQGIAIKRIADLQAREASSDETGEPALVSVDIILRLLKP